MENLDEAIERICSLKGNLMALESTVAALIRVLPRETALALRTSLEKEIEAARVVQLNSERVGEVTREAYEHHAQRQLSILPSGPI